MVGISSRGQSDPCGGSDNEGNQSRKSDVDIQRLSILKVGFRPGVGKAYREGIWSTTVLGEGATHVDGHLQPCGLADKLDARFRVFRLFATLSRCHLELLVLLY